MSKKIVLFSQPTPAVFEKLKIALFPEYLSERIFAYMPSDGSDTEANQKYGKIWQQFAENNDAKFVFINNSKRDEEAEIEKQKVASSNILIITGGNTFTLLNHLKLSGLDKSILEFWKKNNVVLAGFSSGALVLTPSIKIANVIDTNKVELSDLSGLNIVDFQVWPHYTPDQKQQVSQYQTSNNAQVKPIGNDDLIVIEK